MTSAGPVDLHLHTTASDGRLAPDALVAHVAAAGIAVMAVTDHDTIAAVVEVERAAREHGIETATGIEITAVEAERDVHVLGYFFRADDPDFAAFLETQRSRRRSRVEAIAERLAVLGVPVNVGALLDPLQRRSGRSIGRPQVARAMVAAGHVRDTREAFDRWLAVGRPAFIPREGPTLAQAIDAVHAAGGLTSLAHPGKTDIDSRLWALRDAGLDAIEVYHPDHDAGAVDYYARAAIDLGFLVTGGSDFHGDPAHGVEPGTSTLPSHEWQRLRSRARG